VAALLRRHLAHLDSVRRARAELIEALDAYSGQLKAANIAGGQIAGRLRRAAAHCDADAERLDRQRREAITTRRAEAA
jgi:hypothetical protein